MREIRYGIRSVYFRTGVKDVLARFVLSPSTFRPASRVEAMPRLLSHRLRFGTHVIPRLTTPVSLQPHVSSPALPEA